MKLAIISDIHANLVSLKLVLDDIENKSVDRIVCLGDVVELGPQPHEVISYLKQLGGLMVMGNEDEAVLDANASRIYANGADAKIHDIDRWTFGRLTRGDLDYIRSFERSLVISLRESGTQLLLCHGSPRSNKERILPTSPSDEELQQMISGFDLPLIVACGHTHTQMLRRLNGSVVFLNPGSVGMPFRDDVLLDQSKMIFRYAPRAEYAIVTLEPDGKIFVEFRTLPVDTKKVEESIRTSGMPHSDWLISHWRI